MKDFDPDDESTWTPEGMKKFITDGLAQRLKSVIHRPDHVVMQFQTFLNRLNTECGGSTPRFEIVRVSDGTITVRDNASPLIKMMHEIGDIAS